MANKRQTGHSGLSWRWRTALLAGSFGLGVSLFTGCSSPTPVANVSQPADPLHGVLTPPGMPQPTSAPKASVGWNPPPQQQFGAADTTSTNNATLAGMSWQGPLGKPSPIDESGKTQTPGQLTTGGAKTTQTPVNPGFTAPNPSPKVVPIPDAKPGTSTSSWQPVQLNNPEPLPASPTTNPPAVQPISTAPARAPTVQTVGTAPSISSDQLAKQLQDRGVINQKLDPDPDNPQGVILTCYIRRDNQGFRIIDAKGSDYAGAARNIIQQLDASR